MSQGISAQLLSVHHFVEGNLDLMVCVGCTMPAPEAAPEPLAPTHFLKRLFRLC